MARIIIDVPDFDVGNSDKAWSNVGRYVTDAAFMESSKLVVEFDNPVPVQGPQFNLTAKTVTLVNGKPFRVPQ